MTIKVAKGAVHTTAKLTEKGKIKDEVLHDVETDEKVAKTVPDGYAVAMVRGGTFIRLSRNYQSMEVQVGVEMPWPVRPGHTDDLSGAFDEVDALIEDRVAKKITDMEEVLKTLKK